MFICVSHMLAGFCLLIVSSTKRMHILLAVVLPFALIGSLKPISSCSEFANLEFRPHLKFTCWGLLDLHNASIIWRGVLFWV